MLLVSKFRWQESLALCMNTFGASFEVLDTLETKVKLNLELDCLSLSKLLGFFSGVQTRRFSVELHSVANEAYAYLLIKVR